MGNAQSQASVQQKILSLAKKGDYHLLKSLLDQLERNSPDYRVNRSTALDVQDADGSTPLILACTRGHYQVAELLLQRGASLTLQNKKNDGGTALHEAVSHKHDHIITLLLSYHANPFVENIKGYTAIDLACSHRNVELLRRLESLAPWKGWLELKVASILGLSTEWKRRWVVICPRVPSPYTPPDRRRTHVSLLCYKSTNDTRPECRVWLDGARAVEVQKSSALQRTNGRSPAFMELKLHRSHAAPSGCALSGSARDGFALHFRPDEGSARGCSDFRVWGEVVNNRGRPLHHHQQQQQQQQQQTPPPPPPPAAAAAVVRPTPPSGSSGGGSTHQSTPNFSPLSAGAAAGFSDSDIARRLQSIEDEDLARALSGVAPLSGAATSSLAPSIAGSGPISQPSQDISALYPSIRFDGPPAAGGGAGPSPSTPSGGGHNRPPAPPFFTTSTAAAAGMSHSRIPSEPFDSGTAGGSAAAAAPSPPSSRPGGAGQQTPTSVGNINNDDGDDGLCCICLVNKITHGFAHDRQVCRIICEDCADLLDNQGMTQCPNCRAASTIVRVFG